MNPKPLYQYIFGLLDYADLIANRIAPSEPEKNNYFVTLVYIEDILDKYGRSLARESSKEVGKDADETRDLMKQMNERLEVLRKRIRIFSQQYDFDETLISKGKSIYADWHKLPADHPNAQSLEI